LETYFLVIINPKIGLFNFIGGLKPLGQKGGLLNLKKFGPKGIGQFGWEVWNFLSQSRKH